MTDRWKTLSRHKDLVMNKLTEELRKKYKTPQEALLALGLDADILNQGTTEPVLHIGKSQLHFNGAITMGKSLSRKAILAKGVLLGKMAADSHLDLNKMLSGVKRKNWLEKKPGIIATIKPHLAKDADLDQVIELLDKLDRMEEEDLGMDDADTAMDDNSEGIIAKLRGKLSDEDLAEIMEMLNCKPDVAQDDASESKKEDEDKEDKKEDDDKVEAAKDEDEDEDDKKDKKDKEDKMDKAAMDRAIKLACDATEKDAVRKTMARMRAIVEAEELVKPYVGKLAAMDSAEDVLKAALVALNVDVKDIPHHAGTYKTILQHIPNPSEPQRQKSMASDRSLSATADIYAAFPHLSK